MNNVDIARRLYAAVLDPAGLDDPSSLTDVAAPDVVLHDPGSHPLGGEHRGLAGVQRFLTASGAIGPRTEVLDVLDGRDHAAVYCRVRAERDGAVLDNHTVHLLRIADGRVAEVWFHNRDQAHVDRFWNAVLPAATDPT